MHVVVFGSKGMSDVKSAGGVEIGCEALSKRLVQYGVEVTIYQRSKRRKQRSEELLKVRYVPFVNSKHLAGWSHIIFCFFDWLKQRRFGDVIHLHCAQYGIFVLLFKFFRKPVIFHLHGPEWRAKKWGLLTRFVFFMSCLIGVIFADRVLVVCETSKKIILRFLPWSRSKIFLLPNGLPALDSKGIDISEIINEPFILSVGRLVPQKRVESLILVYKILNPVEKLIIVGPDSHSEKYVKYLKTIAEEDSGIMFTGQLDRHILWGLYENCKVLVLCSETEGCSNVLLEALYHKCPIVASDIEQNRAILGTAAQFFSSESENSLLQALTDILSNPEKRLYLKKNAAKRTTQLMTWNEIAKHFIAQYHNVIENSNH